MEVRRLPSLLTGCDATYILWVVKHRLTLSVSPGGKRTHRVIFYKSNTLRKRMIRAYGLAFR